MEAYIKKCLTNFNKQTSMIFTYSLKNAFNQLCKKDTHQTRELIASGPCINKANGEITKCYAQFIDSMLGAINATDKNKMPHVCCEYYKLFPCVEKRTIRVSGCDVDKVSTVLDFIRSIIGNVVDLICGDFTEGSDKCDSIGSPPKKAKSQKRTRSFILPLIWMFESFAEV